MDGLELMFVPVFRIRICLDPFHFGLTDQETDPGGQKSAKTMENFHKNQPKSHEYHIYFSKILNFGLTNIYLPHK